jgi:hypothetical protein
MGESSQQPSNKIYGSVFLLSSLSSRHTVTADVLFVFSLFYNYDVVVCEKGTQTHLKAIRLTRDRKYHPPEAAPLSLSLARCG